MLIGANPSRPVVMVADNIGATIIARSSEVAGYPVSALNNALTYECWKSAAITGLAVFDFGVATTIYGALLAGHNLSGATISIRGSDDGITWTGGAFTVVTDNDAIMFLLQAAQTARYWRIWWTNGTANSTYLAVCQWARDVVLLPECFNTSSSTPLRFARKSTMSLNTGMGGNWLGRSVWRQGLKGQLVSEYVTLSDFIAIIDPFLKRVRYVPFGLAMPSGDVYYCWLTDDPQVSQPQGGYVSITLTVEAYSND